MSTYFDDASLVMLPSGYKDDKLYSIKPTDGSGDFTFSRDGSGASPATRVNSAGLIEKGRTNLLLQSNQFDTTWTQTDISTLTSGQSGYDGTNDAWLVEKSASSNAYLRQNISSSGVHTFSLYAKSGTLDGVLIQTRGASAKSAQFDLSTGTLGTAANNIDAKIEDIGGGWYRCSMSVNDSAITQVRVFICDDGTTIGTTAGSIYIQDAQLEKGLVATSVIETTTAAASAGILGDMPRLDYSGGATCPSLLLEPARTNLLPQSEYFNGWSTVQNATITENDTTSPEGLENAAKITDNATSGNHRIFQSVTTTAQSYTASVFLKKGTMTTAFLRFNSGGDVAGANVDLNAGTITATAGSATIEDYGNDWYRCTITGTAVAGTSYFYVYMKQLSAYSGSGDDLYLYGAQFEAGSYPTSYVPSYGSATARAADVCKDAGSDQSINSTEGVAFVECSFLADDTGENRDIYISDGTATNRIRIRLSSSDVVNFLVYNGSTQANMNYTLPNPTNNNKIAVKWKANDFALWVNGTERATDTSGTTFSANTLDEVSFFTTYNQSLHFHSNVKQLVIFDSALTDAELESLTTI